MPKYTSYSELEREAPSKWAKYTDPDRYESGLNTVAPPGKKLKKVRRDAYDAHTTEKEGKKWLDEWTSALFE